MKSSLDSTLKVRSVADSTNRGSKLSQFFHRVDRAKMSHWFFLSPFVLLLITFGIFPILFSIYLSFHSWNPVYGLGAMKFVGIENYTFALEDPWLWKSLKNTFIMAVVSGLPQHLIGLQRTPARQREVAGEHLAPIRLVHRHPHLLVLSAAVPQIQAQGQRRVCRQGIGHFL